MERFIMASLLGARNGAAGLTVCRRRDILSCERGRRSTRPEPLHEIDIDYLGQAQAIAACVLETSAGLAIIDPGPTRGLEGLLRGMSAAGVQMSDVRWLLLTHIHLDHAGAAGTLTRLLPKLRIYVHPRGAPHLVDPSKLLASANRIYGDKLDELFGAVLPVASDRVCTVADRDVIKLGSRVVRVEHAPGHAVHHVVYLDERTGTAFVGDTAGERFRPSTYVLPVTPPPDIDLVAWHGTLGRLRAWQSESLFLTHFGQFPDSARHLDELEARLNVWSDRVRASLEDTSTDEERAQAFLNQASDELRAEITPELLPKYLSGGIRDSWYGLARYWRRPISR